MNVKMHPNISPRRGGEVVIGNVYTNRHGRPYYKIVMGIIVRDNNRPWNNVVMLHVDATGQICGSSNQPHKYVQDHQDLMGKVVAMPELDIEWLKEPE